MDEKIKSAAQPIEDPEKIDRLRKYFEVLRKNDAPMTALPEVDWLGKELPWFKTVTTTTEELGNIITREPVKNTEEAIQELRNWIDAMIRGLVVIKDIYDQINLFENDVNTGRSLLEENKRLIEEFYQLFMQLVGQRLSNPDTPITVPQRIKDLRAMIFRNVDAYGRLPVVQEYHEWGRGEFQPKGMSRTQWIEAGKPRKKV